MKNVDTFSITLHWPEAGKPSHDFTFEGENLHELRHQVTQLANFKMLAYRDVGIIFDRLKKAKAPFTGSVGDIEIWYAKVDKLAPPKIKSMPQICIERAIAKALP